jgi:L-iditol 2-dehydrogenase
MSKGLINVRPLITHRVPLSQGPEIFERIINKNGFFGKVLFYPEIQ